MKCEGQQELKSKGINAATRTVKPERARTRGNAREQELNQQKKRRHKERWESANEKRHWTRSYRKSCQRIEKRRKGRAMGAPTKEKGHRNRNARIAMTRKA
jgi:hypothetical protein